MRQLLPSTVEYRISGALDLAVGVGAAVAGVALALRPVAGLAEAVVAAGFFGFGMYHLTYRRFVRDAATQAQEIPANTKIATPSATTLRVLRREVWQLAVFALIVLWGTRTLYLIAGVSFGNGLCQLAVSGWVSRWENEHHARLLRAPHWRFNRRGRRGFARGRGIFDPQDFYVRRLSGST